MDYSHVIRTVVGVGKDMLPVTVLTKSVYVS